MSSKRVFNKSTCEHKTLWLFYTASHHCDSVCQGLDLIEVNLFTVVHDNGPVRGHKQHIVSLRPFFIKGPM